jgi:uncharacterized iron-regulated membrane protein
MQRTTAQQLHRWAGLGTALFIVLAGLTGAALAFMDELEALTAPELFVVEPPPGSPGSLGKFIDPIQLRDRVQQRYPNARVDHLSFPQPGKSSLFYLFPRIDPASGKPFPLAVDQVYVNPYTGVVLGDRRWGQLFEDGEFQRHNLMPFIWRMHEALALPHPFGKLFLGLVSLIWTFDSFIGLLLTFPRKQPFLKKWQIAWQIKRGAGTTRLNFDLHRAGALWLWLVLLFFAWTSVMLNLREVVYQPVMSLALRFEPDRPPGLEQPRTEPRLDWQRAHDQARQALQSLSRQQGFTVQGEDSLWYRPAIGAYMYRTFTSLDLRDDRGAGDLWIDGNTGMVLKARFEAVGASGDVFSNWLKVLHTGRIGGTAYRSLLVATGLTIGFLSITGVLIWYFKRQPRRALQPATEAELQAP